MAPLRTKPLLQFRLRTILIAVAVVGFALLPLILRFRRVYAQRAAITVIQRAGGSVTFDYITGGDVPPGPAWLQRLLGDDFFANVDAVYACSCDLDDPAVATFCALTCVEDIRIAGNHVTDKALRHLKTLSSLRSLWLGQTEITGEGLKYCASLNRLEMLDLSSDRISDRSLRHVRRIPSLTTLSLMDTAISDEGIAFLDGLPLESLCLSGTRITDNGMNHLKTCVDLEILWIDNTAVSDNSVRYLACLKKLKVLRMLDTDVSPEAAEELRAALPHCEVFRTFEEWSGS